MTREELEKFVRQSLNALALENPKLPLEKRVGERAIVGRFAFHLAKLITDTALSVDVEYNIDPSGDRKWLNAHDNLRKAAEDLRRKVYEDGTIVVIPDVVIHKRETHDHNIAVIEVKFSDAGFKEIAHAKEKLVAFRNKPFKYIFGVLVTVPRTWTDFFERSLVEISG